MGGPMSYDDEGLKFTYGWGDMFCPLCMWSFPDGASFEHVPGNDVCDRMRTIKKRGLCLSPLPSLGLLARKYGWGDSTGYRESILYYVEPWVARFGNLLPGWSPNRLEVDHGPMFLCFAQLPDDQKELYLTEWELIDNSGKDTGYSHMREWYEHLAKAAGKYIVPPG